MRSAGRTGVCRGARTSIRRGRPQLPHLPDYKWLERIVLPLARDGRTVDMTIGLTVMV